MANKNSSSFLFRGVLSFALSALLVGAGGAGRADGIVPHYLIVHVKGENETEADDAADGIENDYNATAESHLPGTGIYALRLPDTADEKTVAAQMGKDSRVKWAETDTYLACPEIIPSPALPAVSGDPFHFPFDITSGPGLNYNQATFAQIHMGRAQAIATGQGVIVAVLDTGVAMNHLALKYHLLPGYNALAPGTAPLDAPDGAAQASVGHGTMIAGLIAAVAPGAKILPIRVLNGDGVGKASDVAGGIAYAVSHGARVINLSLSSATPSRALSEAIEQAIQANVVVVTAAGNGGNAARVYPAVTDGVLTVSSVENNGVKSAYANYGENVTVVAPGSGLHSAYADGGYASGSGTSFAAPLVSAEAALLFSLPSRPTAAFVRGRIRRTARSVALQNPRYHEMLGAGVIDIEKALRPTPSFAALSPVLAPAAVTLESGATTNVPVNAPLDK